MRTPKEPTRRFAKVFADLEFHHEIARDMTLAQHRHAVEELQREITVFNKAGWIHDQLIADVCLLHHRDLIEYYRMEMIPDDMSLNQWDEAGQPRALSA